MRVNERESGDIAELDRRVKFERNALQRDHLRAVRLALEGEKAVAIARTLSRSRRSVQDWVYAYRDGGIDQLKPKPRPWAFPTGLAWSCVWATIHCLSLACIWRCAARLPIACAHVPRESHR